jgi:hypothetical protein
MLLMVDLYPASFISISDSMIFHASGERALEQLNYSLIKNRAWCVRIFLRFSLFGS